MKTPWGLVLLLWGAGLGAAAQYGKVSVVFDMLPGVYPQAGPAIGWIVSLVGLVGIIFGVVAGLLVARIRYRRALLWGLWIGAAMSVMQAALPPLPWMLLTRAIEGVSHLAMVVAIPTLIAQITAPKDRGFALTLWGSFFGVAFALLAVVGRPLAEGAGLAWLFLAHGFYLIGFALILARKLQSLPEEPEEPALVLSQVLRDHLAIYRSAYMAAPAAGWLFYTFSFVSVLTVLPPYIAAEWRSFVMAAMPLTSIAVSLTFGVWLLRRMSAVGVVQLGFALSAACALWLWGVPGQPAACLALAGAMGLIQGASFAAVPQLNDTARAQARANGAMAQMGNLGNTIGTPVVALVLALAGYGGMPVLIGIAFCLGLMAHVLLGRLRR